MKWLVILKTNNIGKTLSKLGKEKREFRYHYNQIKMETFKTLRKCREF